MISIEFLDVSAVFFLTLRVSEMTVFNTTDEQFWHFCSWYQLDASHIVIPIMLTNECYEKKKHFGCKRLDHVQWQYWSKQNVIKLFIVGWSDQLEYWHHIDYWVAPYTWYSSFRFKGPRFNSVTGPVPVHLQFEINKNYNHFTCNIGM